MAGSIKGITIEIGGNTTPLQNALKSVNTTTRSLKSELRDVERLLKLDPGNVNLLAQKQQLLAQQVENAKKKLDQLREAQAQVQEQFENGKIGEEQYRAFQRELASTEIALKKAEEQLSQFGDTEEETGEDTERLKEAQKKAGDETDKAAEKAEKAKARWEKFGGALKAIATAAAAAAAAIAAAGVKLGTEVISSYADYEQLVGGVETLFGAGGKSLEEYAESVGKTVDEASADYERLMKAQQDVLNNADEAYKTAGLSANEYIETVTGFSASLIASLGGDTEKAARYADMAITDMSDNANKMGSDMQSIQNAYQGFAKQNYTMLDNLKLGYGGTKEEMQRLLEDAEKLSGIHYDISNYADIVDAIHVIQTEMGITGTTAEEAEHTISGSIGMLKASFQNLITGLGNADADIGKLVQNVISSFKSVVENVAPIIENLTRTLPEALTGILEAAAPMLPEFLELGGSLFQSLVDGIMTALPGLLDTAVSIITELISGLTANLPTLVGFGLDLFGALIENLPGIIEEILAVLPEIITAIVDKLTALTPTIVKAGFELFVALVTNLPQIIMAILKAVPEIFKSLKESFTNLWPQMAEVGQSLFGKIVERKDAIVATMQNFVASLVASIQGFFANAFQNFSEIGLNIVQGIGSGIASGWGWLQEQVSNLASSLLQGAKNLLGIHSPSAKFRDEVGKMMAAGIGEGFTAETPKQFVKMKNRLSEEERKLATSVTNNSSVINNTSSLGGIVVNISGAVESAVKAKQMGAEVAEEIIRQLRYKGVLQIA